MKSILNKIVSMTMHNYEVSERVARRMIIDSLERCLFTIAGAFIISAATTSMIILWLLSELKAAL